MLPRALLAFVVAVLAGAGCTTINTVSLPSDPRGNDVFVTAGDINDPHDVLGLVQITRSGVLLFGFIGVPGTDLDAGFKDVLIPHIRQMGGDGAVRARFHMTQYSPSARIAGLIFFFAPLPSEVVITAQVVKLRREARPLPPPPPAATSTTPPSPPASTTPPPPPPKLDAPPPPPPPLR